MMKFVIAFAAIVAVATSSVLKPTGSQAAELEAIIAAIQSPSTDPATAILLEDMLNDILGLPKPEPHPIAVGPAIVDSYHPIAVGPAIIDFPLPDGGALTEVEAPAAPVAPAPVEAPVAPAATPSAPLVQIILNINAGNPGAVVVEQPQPQPQPPTPVPAVVPEGPMPITVVEEAVDNNPQPVVVVENPPESVSVVEPVFPETPVVPEPVLVAEPGLIPSPAINLPEELN